MNSTIRACLLVTLAGAPLALGGCGAFFRQPVNVEVTRQEVETMRKEQAEMLALVRDIKSQVDAQSESMASLRADSNSQLQDLEQRLETLRSQLEDQGVRMDKMITHRVEAGRTPPSPAVNPPGAGMPAAVDTGAVAGAPADTGEGEPGGPPASESELYDAANRDYSRGNYQLAVAGFQDFLKYYPQSDRADNAQYWIGESYFALGDFDQAIQEFLKVRDLYPDGDRVCAATLKIGYADLRKGDSAGARTYLNYVVKECPGTDEARLAQDKLASLR